MFLKYNRVQRDLKIMKEFLLEADFKATKIYPDDDGNSLFALDEVNKLFCIVKQKKQKIVFFKDYPFSELYGNEIIVNGNTITRTLRTNQALMTIAGNVLFGGIGAIVGSLTSKKLTEDKVTSRKIKILINDINDPNFTMNIISPEKIERLNSLLSVIIKNEDKIKKEEERKVNEEIVWKTESIVKQPKNSIVFEIRELKELLDDKLITEEEFFIQKKKILER